MKKLSALLAGILFGFGLAASGMTDVRKIIGFLDVFGEWDSDLAIVMGSAVFTAIIGFSLVFTYRKKPLFDTVFLLPVASSVDKRLIVGSIIFGLGWGMYGYCPGPALASLIYLSPVTFIFVVMMILGMLLANFVSRKIFE